jgi:hypothetical protein
MATSPSGLDPFWIFRSPLSGNVDVAQRITAPWFSPSLTVSYAGDPAVENRVVTEVASYGKQLGWGSLADQSQQAKRRELSTYVFSPIRFCRADERSVA